MLAAELLLLLPFDEAVAGVLPDQGDEGHLLAHGGLQLLTVHHKTAVTADGQHLFVRVQQLGRKGTRNGKAHAGKAVGDQAGVGGVAVVVACDPHFVGTHIAHKDIFPAHDLAHIGKDAGRLHGAAVIVCHGGVLGHHGLA